MSVFDLPRLHFAGTATGKLPTGPRCGLVDFTTHTVRPQVADFPGHLRELGPRYHADGRLDPDGPFSVASGWNFGGNGHFWIDAQVSTVELAAGEPSADDPVVGSAVDLWGHYNAYLRTTVNRARVFDVDPGGPESMTVQVGRFAFGRRGRSHQGGYAASGEVRGVQPPRWVDFRRIREVGEHPLAEQFRYCAVHQFAVAREDGLSWLPAAEASPAVRALRAAAERADGLVVQFALDAMATPPAPDAPNHWRVRGTVAPWHAAELRSHPAGRLLAPDPATDLTPHHLTVRLADGTAQFNLISAIPLAERADLVPVDFGDLELRTASGELIARLPGDKYRDDRTAGLVTVPTEPDGAAAADREPLRLVGAGFALTERELLVQTDEALLLLHHRDTARERDHAVELPIRAYWRGAPAGPRTVRIGHRPNPRSCEHPDPLGLRAPGSGDWAPQCEVRLDHRGHARVAVRGEHPGGCLLLLGPDDTIAARVLPDDWHLDEVPDVEVDFALLHREVFAFYEQLSTFMTAEVFSLADECKVAAYAELIWQMCDPRNRHLTYAMPPGRDLSEPKSRLLLAYLRNVQRRRLPAPVPAVAPVQAAVGVGAGAGVAADPIRTRGRLWAALKQAAALELTVMLQYLYAAFSLPGHAAGRELVRRGRWTERQLALACGGGGADTEDGIRGALFAVAREEMIHFLLVNNIITAMGEPFHLPVIDFATIGAELPVPLDFALEGLHIGSVQRFVAVERPEPPVAAGPVGGGPGAAGPSGWGSISVLYAAIRDGLERVPELFLVEPGRGGGEHHLFLRESVNSAHPDYQLEVDDLAGALVAVDLITEQGEGRGSAAAGPEVSHFQTFCRISETLSTERVKGPAGLLLPWEPAHPVLRNPTLDGADGAKARVTDPAAREVLQLFNRSYLLMTQLMVQQFGEAPDGSLRRSKLMNAAIDVMAGLLRPLAERLVTMPSGRPGRTAGPSFELETVPGFVARPDVARRSLALRFEHLAAAARRCEAAPPQVAELMSFYAGYFRRQAESFHGR
ncbi:ferritin-like domain-containing protein [Kitasatospora viridis]|uniref:Ferritin-like protein n=1 Tax=Kitasatospora viridis TaxID=281105 RepID=A0A561SF75_9ACTN|nr:ferritin-like domain-containing protein [Kitasatospora viridis]TWF73468.1 ferritin-like protein [Kitasatospora viridis]